MTMLIPKLTLLSIRGVQFIVGILLFSALVSLLVDPNPPPGVRVEIILLFCVVMHPRARSIDKTSNILCILSIVPCNLNSYIRVSYICSLPKTQLCHRHRRPSLYWFINHYRLFVTTINCSILMQWMVIRASCRTLCDERPRRIVAT
jgi:hypothetical protein